MTVLASECQGISGSLDVFGVPFPIIVPLIACAVAFLWGWLIHRDGLTIVYSALCAIGRFLRPLFCALRWLHDRFSLGLAWFFVCAAVWSSFVIFLFAWNGLPVPPIECWPVPVLCFFAWAFERLYHWECQSDARYQAFQRGEL